MVDRPARTAPSPTPRDGDPPPARNRVELVGRVAADPLVRVLPSGDEVVAVRVVVPRPEGGAGPAVDALDCAAWTPGARRVVGRWRAGDLVAVEGALRRRFWRGPAGPASRYEVAVEAGRRLAKAAPTAPPRRRPA
jgi:single-strand DNA-binding protein